MSVYWHLKESNPYCFLLSIWGIILLALCPLQQAVWEQQASRANKKVWYNSGSEERSLVLDKNMIVRYLCLCFYHILWTLLPMKEIILWILGKVCWAGMQQLPAYNFRCLLFHRIQMLKCSNIVDCCLATHAFVAINDFTQTPFRQVLWCLGG